MNITMVIDPLLDAACARQKAAEPPRQYIGASEIGDECERRVQLAYMGHRAPVDGQLARIFERGQRLESALVEWLTLAGFKVGFQQAAFSAFDGRFAGHTDGMVVAAPEVAKIAVPALLELKWLGDKGWHALDRDGLRAAYPKYYAQVAAYQRHLGLSENPALFIAGNANTMAVYSEEVPFDPAEADKVDNRVWRILAATEAGELLPRAGKKTDAPCKWCGIAAMCWTAQL